MKKPIFHILVAVLFALVLDKHAAGQTNLRDPGTFIHYLDTRDGEEAIYGYLRTGKEEYIVRRFVPSTGFDISVVFSVAESVSGFVAEPKGYLLEESAAVGDENFHAEAGRMSARLTELLTWASYADAADGFPKDKTVRVKTGQGATEISISPWYPLFSVRSGRNISTGGGHFEAVACGKIDENRDPGFFDFTLPSPRAVHPSRTIVPAKARPRTALGVLLKLDDNWTPQGETRFVLKGETPRDAFISAASLDSLEIGAAILFEEFLLADEGGNFKDLRTLSVYLSSGNPVIEYKIMDRETGRSTKSIGVVLAGDKKDVKLVLFGAFAELFEGNDDYFRKIVFSH
jgi:hypothetical protein